MMILATLIFTATLTTPIGATTKRSTCENEATRDKSAASAYLRLASKGLILDALNPLDLKWAETSDEPVNPIRTGKTLNSLSLMRAISDLLPQISQGEWKNLKSELKKLRKNEIQKQLQVDGAQADTAPLYHWSKLPFKPQGPVINQYVARNGEIFVFSQENASTYITELHQTSIHTFNFHSATPENHDFYETHSGRVLFASISETGIHVIDARLGKSIFDFQIKDHEHLKDASEDGKFLVHLYESDGHVHLAVLPHFTRTDSETPYVVIDIEERRLFERKFPHGFSLNIKRLENGHLYVYGIGLSEASRTNKVFIFDVNSNRYVLKRTFPKIESSIIRNCKYDLFLSSSGALELTFLQYENRELYRFDRSKNALTKILDYRDGSRSPILFSPSAGKIYLLTHMSTGPTSTQITIAPLDGGPIIERDIPLRDPNGFLIFNSVVMTPLGPTLIFSEARRFKTLSVSLLELTTGDHYTLPVTNEVGALLTSFYSPRDRRLMVFGHHALRINQYNPFQLWGSKDD